MTRAEISSISPFFIVQDLARALSFYRDRLGFEVIFEGPADDPFFGIVRRGGAMIMFKDLGVEPLPNYGREPAFGWDAYLDVPDPDALAAEFASRNVEFSERQMLRHTVATLAYRGGKAVRHAPEGFATFRIGANTRTPEKILAHIGDLLDWALALAQGKQVWHDSAPLPWNQEVERLAGAPVRGENYFKADIVAGRVGAAARVEFD